MVSKCRIVGALGSGVSWSSGKTRDFQCYSESDEGVILTVHSLVFVFILKGGSTFSTFSQAYTEYSFLGLSLIQKCTTKC